MNILNAVKLLIISIYSANYTCGVVGATAYLYVASVTCSLFLATYKYVRAIFIGAGLPGLCATLSRRRHWIPYANIFGQRIT